MEVIKMKKIKIMLNETVPEIGDYEEPKSYDLGFIQGLRKALDSLLDSTDLVVLSNYKKYMFHGRNGFHGTLEVSDFHSHLTSSFIVFINRSWVLGVPKDAGDFISPAMKPIPPWYRLKVNRLYPRVLPPIGYSLRLCFIVHSDVEIDYCGEKTRIEPIKD